MKIPGAYLPLVGLVGLVLAAWAPPLKPRPASWAIILGGDTDGYLSPCGCTEPMSGGIRRRAAATRLLSFGSRTLLLDNGSMAGGVSRQDQMKAQTLAQALARMGVAAINFAPGDARLGIGFALSLDGLSGHRLTSASVEQQTVGLLDRVEKGPFVVEAASIDADSLADSLDGRPVSADQVAQDLVDFCRAAGKTSILLLQGSQADARNLAKRCPELGLIQYRSAGDPPEHPEHVGNTLLVTTGERGKSIVRLVWNGSRFSAYQVKHLGPEVSDDPTASRLFESYLKRVESEDLLAQVPRRITAAYAGSSACASCHAEESRVWKGSAHAHALATLEAKHEGSDPECVSCHVTGLDSDSGFRTRILNPQLAFVGCESCHGPAMAHSLKPEVKLPRVGREVCVTCHTPLNSPNFVFESYWRKIRH